jgi:hypothetical protein
MYFVIAVAFILSPFQTLAHSPFRFPNNSPFKIARNRLLSFFLRRPIFQSFSDDSRCPLQTSSVTLVFELLRITPLQCLPLLFHGNPFHAFLHVLCSAAASWRPMPSLAPSFSAFSNPGSPFPYSTRRAGHAAFRCRPPPTPAK